ncbi:Enhancer of polycomb 2 [Orchesella cincta]|uniref:Enhancer of polycomb 2 n=1 Tax=Orchesella cincta TaxID=48709 RepID=A0A1D2MN51_ORCCI|nr:Enhancer of polycomb 2 [Orchesella cincta]
MLRQCFGALSCCAVNSVARQGILVVVASLCGRDQLLLTPPSRSSSHQRFENPTQPRTPPSLWLGLAGSASLGGRARPPNLTAPHHCLTQVIEVNTIKYRREPSLHDSEGAGRQQALPIYLADEIPDTADCSLINRAVPQMPTGMEKEEESCQLRITCFH